MRQLLCILLMFCLPLQGFAMQWGSAMQPGGMSLTHEALHDERISHHHEGDGTIHYDTSDESAQHAQDHSCSPQPAGLITEFDPVPPQQLVSQLTADTVQFVPDPELDCPHRPPASALG